jgi:hypothetical protein
MKGEAARHERQPSMLRRTTTPGLIPPNSGAWGLPSKTETQARNPSLDGNNGLNANTESSF